MVAIAGVVCSSSRCRANAGQSTKWKLWPPRSWAGRLFAEKEISGTVLGAIVVAIIRNAITAAPISLSADDTGAVICWPSLSTQRQGPGRKRVGIDLSFTSCKIALRDNIILKEDNHMKVTCDLADRAVPT